MFNGKGKFMADRIELTFFSIFFLSIFVAMAFAAVQRI